MKYIFVSFLLLFLPLTLMGQETSTLSQLATIIEGVRQKKTTKADYSKAVNAMYKLDVKITLLDDIGMNSAAHKNLNKFRIQGMIDCLAKSRSETSISKGDYYNSLQNGYNYSIIETSVKAGRKADFTITRHKGYQEIIVIPFTINSKSSVDVTCSHYHVSSKRKDDRYSFSIDEVKTDDVIHIYITNSSKAIQSYAILNYNKKK